MATTARRRAARPHLTLRHLALAAALLCATAAHASGGDGFGESPLTPEWHVPVSELPAFAAGRLGVLPGSHWRVFLFLAWRAANGRPLSAEEVKALDLNEWRVGPWSHGISVETDDPQSMLKGWQTARDAAAAALPAASRPAPPAPIGAERSTEDWSSYLNCPADTFARAAQTLSERRRLPDWPAWGSAWLAQQDQVFANCSPDDARPGQPAPPPRLPAALASGAPAWLAKDRAYQLAAAQFYAGQYPAARAGFQAIAKDGASPWQPLGAYLAARALVRQATLATGADKQPDRSETGWRQPLATARQELLALAPTQPAAAALVGWVDARLRPRERAQELSQQLSGAPVNRQTAAALGDYLRLLDGLTPQQLAESPDAMTRWIGLMQASQDGRTGVDAVSPQPAGDPATEREAAARGALEGGALQRLAANLARQAVAKDSKAPAGLWLAPLLALARPAGAGVPPERVLTEAEQRAALAVPAGSPLYQHLRYHLARLQIEQGQGAAADAGISAMLADAKQAMSIATRNRWLGLKMLSAPTLAGFLAAVPRRVLTEEAGQPIIDADRTVEKGTSKAEAPAPQFQPADDFPLRLYRNLPLSVLKLAQRAPALPGTETTRLAEVIWTRAALLGDWASADEMAPLLAAPRTTTKALWDRYAAANSPAAKREAAVVIWANTPELDPALVNDQGLQQSWGCITYANVDTTADPTHLAGPAFLTAAEREAARAEQAKLQALPLRSEYLGPPLLAWARSHTSDPEAPKALHFFVASTRMECRGVPAHPRPKDNPATDSKDAFQLLHKQWPKSEWAGKTKYYY
ncbi:hypothetical protein LRH25_06325 [Ideonella azotifigens]|uniref:Lytic transglycosylase domain-containing protein n=2 Tax=Ideonella azotifigens TaxID=513160 RepID=A0ABP3UZN6_9BURK|nr:hypothetical protein [Ideonella azotifigens]MCD2339954.1 hypothetical protein [Ideonella azotifigens]